MLSFNIIVSICAIYAIVLFSVAAFADRQAKKNRINFLHSPIVYTLSLSVYCTAWTYYGSVGTAARNGFEFLTIYLGPTIVFVGWWWFLRKLVRIGRTKHITSIADLISSRYGKSNLLGVIVTLLAVFGSTPYIALQLQSLTLSFSVFTNDSSAQGSPAITAFFIAFGLAVFTILFGTRNIDANERHHGVVTAIALEAIVKLIALLAVGIFVIWGVSDGPSTTLALMEQNIPQGQGLFTPRWVTLTFLSASAIICLPRMFQVVVVENTAEHHLATASWAFPLYLFLMCIFVLPIAATGLSILPKDANPDLFVLTIPLAQGQEGLAALAFLGGFSSATSMVIIAAIALSTMMSNHIILPLWLHASRWRNPKSDDIRKALLRMRRISIALILALGYFYFILTGGKTALTSIGLIAFLGVAQVLPALIGGLFWRNATRPAAILGISAGFIIWTYTLLIPSFDANTILSQSIIDNGPFGLSILRPQSLFGIHIQDPLIHATFWSIAINSIIFLGYSLLSTPKPLEHIQAQQFLNVYGKTFRMRPVNDMATPENMFILAQRILGRNDASILFSKHASLQGVTEGLPKITTQFMEILEREFSGSVGAATAYTMIKQVLGSEAISVQDLITATDKTVQVIEYSARLEEQSKELKKTAEELRTVNAKLTLLSNQKDVFLSQVSHELRTPMTAIRSFSEILRTNSNLDIEKQRHFSSVINEESKRLTRLLDEILDLSVLESNRVKLNLKKICLTSVIERALQATQDIISNNSAIIHISNKNTQKIIKTDPDRLSQVFINLISNAIKYCDKSKPRLNITCTSTKSFITIIFKDNGPGISKADHSKIFEKFLQLQPSSGISGVGLGLAISKRIMRNLGGNLECIPNKTGAIFKVTLPI